MIRFISVTIVSILTLISLINAERLDPDVPFDKDTLKNDIVELAQQNNKINNSKEVYDYLKSKNLDKCWLVTLVNVGPRNISWDAKSNQTLWVAFRADEEPNIGHNLLVSEVVKRSEEETESMKKCLAELFDSLMPIGFHIFIDLNYFQRRIYQCKADKMVIGWAKSGSVEFDVIDCGRDKPNYFFRDISHTFGRLGWLIF